MSLRKKAIVQNKGNLQDFSFFMDFLKSLSMEEKMGMSIINTMEAAHEKSITNCIR